MTARHVTADVLLGLAVLVVLAACVGVLVMRGVYAKLHFLTPVALVAPFLMGLRENTSDSWLMLALLVLSGPFLSHATLRAARIREKGDWRPGTKAAGRGKSADGEKGGAEAGGGGADAGKEPR
jgi:multisubunit Na+/H+ antiporter MnhG subunit